MLRQIKIPVFFSFHYKNDAFRAQQIRNMRALDGNTPVNANAWEALKIAGDARVKNWIDTSLKYRRCVIVLVGSETAGRPWVNYEIETAWNLGKPMFGIRIHNLRCPNTGIQKAGPNPFDAVLTRTKTPLSHFTSCYDPGSLDTYRVIRDNIQRWTTAAILQRKNQ